MIFIKRSYKVLGFLNRRHILLSRMLFAFLGGIVALITTGRIVLAYELASRFANDEFKLAGRRAGFYLRSSWIGREIAFDPFFNFTEGLNQQQLQSLKKYVEARAKKQSAGQNAEYMLLINAAEAHFELESDGQENFERAKSAFQKSANDLLSDVSGVDQKAALATKSMAKDTPNFAKHATQVLNDFENDLPIDEWNWFVLGGTFLGMVRDNGFLPHDEDLDVGLFLEGLDLERFLKVFENSSHFSVAKYDIQSEIMRRDDGTYYIRRVPAMLKLVHSNGVNLDVFLHEYRDQKIWHGSGVHKWVNDPFKLTEYELEGQKVMGPNPADHYLREHYGEWHIVVKEFSCTTGTTNLAFVKNLFTIATLLNRLKHFANTNPMEALKISNELIQQGYLTKNSGKLHLSKNFI